MGPYGLRSRPHFLLTIRDVRGRCADGAGSSKKAASRVAAEAFIRRWMPEVLPGDSGREGGVVARPREPASYEDASRAHRTAVAGFTAMFELPRRANPYVTQALTHSSWIYESKRVVQRAGQRDNSLLAHHGSVVADVLVADRKVRAALGCSSVLEAGELTILTPDEQILRDFFAGLRLAPGLLLGAGQWSNPAPTYAGAMQAVLAVAWRFSGSKVLSAPPAVLAEWVRTSGPVLDAATRLHSICGAFGVELETDFARRWPDHQRQYAATVTLRETGTRVSVAGEWVRGDKPLAAKRCAERVLRVLLEFTHSEHWNLSADERRTAAFLLRAQLKNAAQLSRRNLER